MLKLFINESSLEGRVMGMLLDKATDRFGINGKGLSGFVLESVDEVDCLDLADDVITKLRKKELLESNSFCGNYIIKRELYENLNRTLEIEEELDEDDEELDYLDFDSIDEIESVLTDIVDEAYEEMNLGEKFSRAYNKYIRQEIYDEY